jgi:photosystem II stability/assembly factor-like uncharacterized protein
LVNDFREVYDNCRYTVMGVYYNGVLQKENEFYEAFLAMSILFMTIQLMHTKYLAKDIGRDFYDIESIRYIYNAYGAPFFSDIPLTFHRRIVKNMNRLLQVKGSTKVFYELSDLMDYKNLDIYEYYLIKSHKRDDSGLPLFIPEEDGNVLLSEQNGDGWEDINISRITTKNLNDIVFYNGSFIAVGNNGTIIRSTNGRNWTAITQNASSVNLNKIVYYDGRFTAVGDTGRILTSTNGDTWSLRDLSTVSSRNLNSVSEDGKMLVGDYGIIFYNTSGLAYTKLMNSSITDLLDVSVGNGVYIAVGKKKTILRCENLEDWIEISSPAGVPDGGYYGVYYINGIFYICGLSLILRSTDGGLTWDYIDLRQDIDSVLYGISSINDGSYFYAYGQDGTMLSSPDGLIWTPEEIVETINSLRGFAWDGESHIVIVGISYKHDSHSMYQIKFGKVRLYDNPPLELADPSNHLTYEEMIPEDNYLYWISDQKLWDKLYTARFNYRDTKFIGIQTVFDLMKIMLEICYFNKEIVDNRFSLETIRPYVPYLGRNARIFDLLIYAAALVCKNLYGENALRGLISAQLPTVSKLLGYNFKADLTELQTYISEHNIDNTDYIANMIMDMNVNSLASINSTFAKIENLRTYLSSKMTSSTKKETFFAFKHVFETLMYSEVVEESYKKSDDVIAESYEDLLRDIDGDLWIRLNSPDMDLDTEIDSLLIFLKTTFNNLKYIEYASGKDIGVLIEQLFKLLNFFKSAKAELNNYRIIYTLNLRGYNFIKWIADINLIKVTWWDQLYFKQFQDAIWLIKMKYWDNERFPDLDDNVPIIFETVFVRDMFEWIVDRWDDLTDVIKEPYRTDMFMEDLMQSYIHMVLLDNVRLSDKKRDDLIVRYTGLERITDLFIEIIDKIVARIHKVFLKDAIPLLAKVRKIRQKLVEIKIVFEMTSDVDKISDIIMDKQKIDMHLYDVIVNRYHKAEKIIYDLIAEIRFIKTKERIEEENYSGYIDMADIKDTTFVDEIFNTDDMYEEQLKAFLSVIHVNNSVKSDYGMSDSLKLVSSQTFE